MPLSFDVDALLLDMDGTLVDSTAVVNRALAVLAPELGLAPELLVGRWHGVPGRQMFRRLDPTLSDLEVEAWQARLTTLEEADPEPVTVLPGALELLTALPPDRWAVVTSAPRVLVDARLASSGLPVPRALVTAEDVVVGKPDPEPYVKGARLLGVPPERCLAVEDAESGLVSARTAGCQVLGVLTTYPTLPEAAVPDLSHVSVAVVGDGSLRVTAG